MPPSTITRVGDAQLIERISAATKRLIFLAPGTSRKVAEALCGAWMKLGLGAVNIVLDVDPEVCRLGYGSINALELLAETARTLHTMIHHQPGIRIGLLITDDSTLIYAPTPELIEGGSTNPEHPNAILLESVPQKVANEVGIGEHGVSEQTIGMDQVPPALIKKVAEDIARNPPVQFSVARKVRVFNAQFEFVEFELHGCSISRKTVPIPSDLVGLAKDEKTKRLLKSTFRLIDDESSLSGDRVLKLKQFIVQKYLILLPNYGTIVLRKNKDSFLEAVQALGKYIKRFQKRVKRELEKEIQVNRDSLAKALFPAIKASPPKRWEKYLGRMQDPQQVKDLLDEELAAAFGSADAIFGKMTVSVVFKGVTYESLIDPKFIEVASKAIPFIKSLHKEYDAAPATGR